MYDKVNGYTVANPIDRYALGGDDELKRNADGSLTLYVQPDNPGRSGSQTGCRRRRGRSILSSGFMSLCLRPQRR
jgi:hypothetical protein